MKLLNRIAIIGLLLLASCKQEKTKDEIETATNKLRLMAYEIGLKENAVKRETEPGQIALDMDEIRRLKDKADAFAKESIDAGTVTESEAEALMKEEKRRGAVTGEKDYVEMKRKLGF